MLKIYWVSFGVIGLVVVSGLRVVFGGGRGFVVEVRIVGGGYRCLERAGGGV